MIIGALNVNYQDYINNEYEIYNTVSALAKEEKIRCAICNQPVGMHGSYKRTVIMTEFEVRKITIVQVKCKNCKKVHAVIPQFISPNKQYTLQVIKSALYNQKLNSCCADESTIRRWRSYFQIETNNPK